MSRQSCPVAKKKKLTPRIWGVTQGMARANVCVTHGKSCVTRHAKTNVCVTHGKSQGMQRQMHV